ncbi:MAG: hypothetical protein IIW03_05065 [Clostridia bacterium]|nr:hypothetical protein [Clostridia bacterium]
MLITLRLIKKRGVFYKIRAKQVGDNIIIYAPPPKTKRRKHKLIKVLYPYAGQIIYPKGFNAEDYPKPFDLNRAVKRKKLENFLKQCKIKRPNTAVIVSKGLIKNNYFKDISPFVGKIILPDTPYAKDLQNEILAFSGTPIIFGGEVPKSDKDTLILLL